MCNMTSLRPLQTVQISVTIAKLATAWFFVQHPHQEVFITEHRSTFWMLIIIMRRFMEAAVLFVLERKKVMMKMLVAVSDPAKESVIG